MPVSAYVIFDSFYDGCREMDSVNSEVERGKKNYNQIIV